MLYIGKGPPITKHKERELIMPSFEKTVYGLSRKLNILSGIALVLMMGLVFVNVVLRAVWYPILGTYEFTSFLASGTIAFALAHCAANNGHIAITIFADRLPARVQAILDTVVAILGTTLFAVIAWQCVRYALNMYHSGEVSPTTETPFYPFIFGIAFGLLMLAVVLLNDIIKSLGKIFK
jgi:TRAP-type C4-dicarboxylate transport system permease small subunit